MSEQTIEQKLMEKLLTAIEEDSFLEAGINNSQGMSFKRPNCVDGGAGIIKRFLEAEGYDITKISQ